MFMAATCRSGIISRWNVHPPKVSMQDPTQTLLSQLQRLRFAFNRPSKHTNAEAPGLAETSMATTRVGGHKVWHVAPRHYTPRRGLLQLHRLVGLRIGLLRGGNFPLSLWRPLSYPARVGGSYLLACFLCVPAYCFVHLRLGRRALPRPWRPMECWLASRAVSRGWAAVSSWCRFC